MKRLYTQKEVSRLIGVSESQIRYWDRTELIPCTEKKRGALLFDFKALVAFRTVKQLLNKGISTRKIRRYVEKVKHHIPEIRHPLQEVSITISGDRVIMGKDNLKFTPEGQLFIDFASQKKAPVSLAIDPTEERFFQALEYEQQEDWHRAQEKYRQVLEINPAHPDALVNLGNIRHREGDVKGAAQYYRRALREDPDHVEANYNLANLFEDRGDLENAVLFYYKCLHEDPEFADAHFNLGLVLERLGNLDAAKRHWSIYLALDATSQWARYLRSRLREMEEEDRNGE